MAVNIQDLLQNGELNESARESITEAWESRLAEAREEITAELREEFAQRYEHDRGQIVEAVDSFISAQLSKELSGLAEDKRDLAAERVKYRKAIGEHTVLLNKFIKEALAKEIRELAADRAQAKQNMIKLDKFVAEQLAHELEDFQADKQALVEQKVKMVREGKAQLAEAKKNFVKTAAEKVEQTVNKVISEEIREYRKDIIESRKNDLGRRIFEGFAQEFSNSYLNESAEVNAVAKELAALKTQLSEATKAIEAEAEQRKLVESKLRATQDRLDRKQKLDELLQPLNKAKKDIMADLLESVKTEKLEESFNKYLPSVLDGDTKPARKPLTESVTKEHTGNKTAQPSVQTPEAEQDVVDLGELRKLAGLSN